MVVWGGVGWGGDRMIMFLAHVHIFDATPRMCFVVGGDNRAKK